MNSIVQLYWLRVALAVVAGVISAVLALVTGSSSVNSINTLMNAIIVALVVYLASYYILRSKYSKTIEPQSKILMTGIGIYFFTWLASFVLIYTIVTTIQF